MKFLKFTLKWGFVFSAWLAVIGTIGVFYYSYDLPQIDSSDVQGSKQVVHVNYEDGERITNFGDNVGGDVKFYELPPYLINAVVATEDRRFFHHHGVDIFGIVRAFYVNQKAGRIVQGGSTITQQLAKLLFLTSDRNFKRKIQEVLLAFELEYSLTKEKILTLYLNRAYFGSGNYGVGNAAKFYFGKDVSKINLNEAAMLAGLLKAPSKLSPKNNQELAEDRANVVVENMIDAGYLADSDIAAMNKDVEYKTNNLQKLYFADFVKDQFPDFISSNFKHEKTISIKTTLDELIQNKLEEVLNQFVRNNSEKLGKSQIAVVIMKKDGAVVGMSGGNDYQKSQFNRAVYAKRQSGSAFKTFVYLAAFENGFKPDDVFEDKKIATGVWLPGNYNDKYFGEVTLKEAFSKSLNSVAVQLAQQLSGDIIAKSANRMGIVSKIDKDDPTIVLGTTEVSLYELTSAYATIANDGEAVIPYIISEIKNDKNEDLYVRTSSGLGNVISNQAEEHILEVLQEVVRTGTGKNANVAVNIRGKTGTSQNYRDAWFVGFNTNYVMGVWIGNDDNSPTNQITGGSLPASLFYEVMKRIN